MATTLGQRCTVFLDEKGIQRFKIDNSIDSVLAGDLPVYGPPPHTSNIFVHKIINPLDPKSDTFIRVGNVADLTTLALGREIAVGLNQSLYLSTEFSVTYDDIATATTAKLLIQQRVDNIVADWHTYNEQFLAPLTTPPDLSTIPLPLNTSIVSERTAAYNTAHAELLQAKIDAALAAAAAAATAQASTDANERVADDIQESQQITTLLGHFNGGYNTMKGYRQTVNNFRTASTAFYNAVLAFQAAADLYRAIAGTPNAGDKATYDFAESTFNTAKTTYLNTIAIMDAEAATETADGEAVLDAFHTEFATFSTQELADVGISAQKKKDADKASGVAATAKAAADQVASTALIADSATFLSLKEVCPTAERTVP